MHARNENGVMLIAEGTGIPRAFLGLSKVLDATSPFATKSILPKRHMHAVLLYRYFPSGKS